MSRGRRGDDAREARGARHHLRLWTIVLLVVVSSLAGWAVFRGWLEGRQDPQELWEQAQAELSSGKPEQAEETLGRLARRRPSTLADRLLMAQVARQQGRLDRALGALDGHPENEPGAALIERTRGMLEFERDRARASEAALLKAISLDPKLSEARRDLINVYTVQSRRRELSTQFRELSALVSLNFADLYLWSLGRRQDVGPAELAAKLERMLRNDPDDRPTRLALAENLRRLGRLDESEEMLAPMPATDPDARAERARVVLDRGDADVAAHLLAEGPADHGALARLRGQLALARGDTSALEHFRLALAAEPDDRDSNFGLGLALRQSGQLEAALPYLDSARNLDRLDQVIENARSSSRRDDPKTLMSIGDACLAVRRLAEARAWYRLALSHDPLDGRLQKRLFEIEIRAKNGASVSDRSWPKN